MKTEVLKFYANWCGPCRVLSQRLEGENFTEINIDTEHETAVKYKVRSVPTLIFLKDGEEVHRAVGLITKTEHDLILDKINDKKDVDNIEVSAEIVKPNTEE
jgi:thioredoxin 1